MPHLILSVGFAEPSSTGRTVHGCRIITWLIAGGHGLAQMLHIRGLRLFVYHGAPRVTILRVFISIGFSAQDRQRVSNQAGSLNQTYDYFQVPPTSLTGNSLVRSG
jgi:hypothetical protein